MNNKYLYLESGTYIGIGTVFQIFDSKTEINGWYQVTDIEYEKFVKSECFAHFGSVPFYGEMHISDIQSMFNNGLIKIYNM